MHGKFTTTEELTAQFLPPALPRVFSDSRNVLEVREIMERVGLVWQCVSKGAPTFTGEGNYHARTCKEECWSFSGIIHLKSPSQGLDTICPWQKFSSSLHQLGRCSLSHQSSHNWFNEWIWGNILLKCSLDAKVKPFWGLECIRLKCLYEMCEDLFINTAINSETRTG